MTGVFKEQQGGQSGGSKEGGKRVRWEARRWGAMDGAGSIRHCKSVLLPWKLHKGHAVG